MQSGKTANFTGVIAKAIDAGYRLVIVLTGTIDILREQTQRRLDMELVGEENILQALGRERPGPGAARLRATTPDWADKFLSYGVPAVRAGDLPDIIRLTGTAANDYRKPEARHRRARDRRRTNKLKPLYDPDNLFPCGARLAVVKKNATVLQAPRQRPEEDRASNSARSPP